MYSRVPVGFRSNTRSSIRIPSVIHTSSGNVNFISLATFTASFMPPLPEGIDFDALVRRLKRVKAPTRRIITKNGRLWGYSTRNPSQLTCKREHVFSHIGSCVKRLAKKFSDRPVSYSFQDDQDFEECHMESFPAAYFHAPESEPSQRLDWTRIAVPGTYQMFAEGGSFERVRANDSRLRCRAHLSEQNVRNIVRYMSRCMEENPMRRFVYGFTVEDTRMRLWYCDRAHIIASTPFDFVTVSVSLRSRSITDTYLRTIAIF